ncbi:hypothetical protein K7X08_033746 [Anisodus acutangulus]|uniref:Uncharacterized protein n=1 Tax=Anisodus acutangulus TaxID=402998 RepID=A0A9Q1M788_9SOLA|nr:hypothetical protein K7X08_033746 [Anisodus acutangulus]
MDNEGCCRNFALGLTAAIHAVTLGPIIKQYPFVLAPFPICSALSHSSLSFLPSFTCSSNAVGMLPVQVLAP